MRRGTSKCAWECCGIACRTQKGCSWHACMHGACSGFARAEEDAACRGPRACMHACVRCSGSARAHQMPHAKCTGTESSGSSMRQALSALEVASMMSPDAMPMMTAL